MKQSENKNQKKSASIRLLRPEMLENETSSKRSILEQLADGNARATITFAGQGIGYLDELARLYEEHEVARTIIDATSEILLDLVDEQAFTWSGFYSRGFDLAQWIHKPDTRPDATYMSSSAISQPLIFTTQVARYAATYAQGLDGAIQAGSILGTTGHSQGIMASILIAETPDGSIDLARFKDHVTYMAWQGFHMQGSFASTQQKRTQDPEATPMAAVGNLDLAILLPVVDRVNATLPKSERMAVSLRNTRNRNVASGPASSLEKLHQALQAKAEKEQKMKKEGRFGGKPTSFIWEYLPVSAAFHSPMMERGLEAMRKTVKEIKFSAEGKKLHMDVYAPDGEGLMNRSKDLTDHLIRSQFMDPVCWQKTLVGMSTIEGLTHVIDCGPGDGVARLSMSSLRGTGITTLPISLESGRDSLFDADAPLNVRVQDYRRYAPKLAKLPDGRIVVNNRFTRATRRSPVILPGMTPTTVDVPIVAAAANGGFVSELAGGGQVTEKMFQLRIEELTANLDAGQEVVFNGLYLDPYLWDLHVRKAGLVQKAKKAGAPLAGVTISAGIPELEEASKLLEEFESIGLWLNAFKPGNTQQVKQICKIANANQERTIYVHLEGGKAGGHHSWEDLDQLLIDTYHLLRAEENIILCVGGGIATEKRGAELIIGSWSKKHGLPPMPVDAIFLGTPCMACKEATATEDVKNALVRAGGTDAWVFAGDVQGNVTSGKSQLNADIHYLDNAASRTGRLLDALAGDEETINARRHEIIDALNKTAKPYFGDLHEMTYAEVLERMIDLMAVGEKTRYEDGIWPDLSYRERVREFIRRAEARICEKDEGTIVSVLKSDADLDAPRKVMKNFLTAYPQAKSTTLHPMDVRHFIYEVCARPGKPVNFVPVVNADVRRWYKSDSLWQAQSGRYSAEQVLVIPGPEAVKSIKTKNEKIADLLGRFEKAVVKTLQSNGTKATAVEGLWSLDDDAVLGNGFAVVESDTRTVITATSPEDADAWFAPIATRFNGSLAALLSSPRVFEGKRSVENPIRQMCVATPGAVLEIESNNEGIAQTLVYRTSEDAGEALTLTLKKNAIEVCVAAQLVPHGEAATAQFTFQLHHKTKSVTQHFAIDPKAWDSQLTDFYHAALFGRALKATPLFETAKSTMKVEANRVQGYGAITGAPATGDIMPLNMGFSLAWEPIFRVLSADELSGGLLRLVHLSNRFDTHAGWPIQGGDTVQVSARVVKIENAAQGRTIITESEIRRDRIPCLTIVSAFFVRDAFGHLPLQAQVRESLQQDIVISSEADARWLQEHVALTWSKGFTPKPGTTLQLNAEIGEDLLRNGTGHFTANGSITANGRKIATLQVDEKGETHPVRTLVDALGDMPSTPANVALATLAKEDTYTPTAMKGFADVGLDRNPIHTSQLMARLGGLDGCIVHGMWTSARAHAFLLEHITKGDAERIIDFQADFLSPALPGESITMAASQVGAIDGDLIVEVSVQANREEGATPLMRARAKVRRPRTAYVFPGQGIQQKGMGMEGYARSAAARDIWDKADAFTRRDLGFSILQVVKENPGELVVNGHPQIHEKGVLNLTQFTQVAMAVLAQAQVAELNEAGLLSSDTVVCGHSVGEYNAISALGGILPLDVLVRTVYERGMAMHRLVPRDANGESGFRMGVIRPHYAGLDEDSMEALVKEIAKRTGKHIQIVNYNIRGRQYSVTGRAEALAALQEALIELAPADAKPAYIEVPGIDVPFHSDQLANGVDSFRHTLEDRFPKKLEWQRLVGHYVPNLVPKPFTLEKAFVQEVADHTDSAPLKQVLRQWKKASANPDSLARTLLIELLCWQFASPVRWIETQDLLFAPREEGGLGVSTILEIGVGYQPTLTNMARYSLTLLGDAAPDVAVVNVEANAEDVFLLVGDPEEVFEEEEVAEEASAAETPAAQAAPAPAPAAPVAPTTAAPVEDTPIPVGEALKVILALQAKVRPDQISDSETIDELFEGVSSRRNQVLLDIGAEFNLGTIDGAHEQAISALTGEIAKRCSTYKASGTYIRAAQDEGIKRVFGRSGMVRKDIQSYVGQTFGLGAGLTDACINTVTLASREGDSSRGGALGELGDSAPASKGEAQALLDKAATLLGQQRGVAIAKQGGGAATSGGGAVDSAVVSELEGKVLGREGALMQVARDLADHLGYALDAGPGLSEENEAQSRLDAFIEEHGAAYEELIAPMFSAKKHVPLTSGWAWAQRDVARLAFEGVAGQLSADQIKGTVQRLRNHTDSRVKNTANWYRQWAEKQGATSTARALKRIGGKGRNESMFWRPTRPSLEITASGEALYEEVIDQRKDAITSFVSDLQLTGTSPLVKIGEDASWNKTFKAVLEGAAVKAYAFQGKTAVVTGAGPNSIALEMVRHLLYGGARVIVTTSSFSKKRIRFYRKFYSDNAGPGAELHVVPFNQTSLKDVQAFVSWLFSTITEQAGASVKVVKHPFSPDMLIPFAAIKDLATMDTMGPRSQAAMRTMLLSVETLIGAISNEFKARGVPDNPCHVLLPLSPNHGEFGGDGAYAETKAALEVLTNKWFSEKDAWGHCTTLCTARIGWVRGTGLMDANNPVAAALEEKTGVRTFSTAEMAYMLVGLCSSEARENATKAPLAADLTGGFSDIDDLKGTVEGIRNEIESHTINARRLSALKQMEGGAANDDSLGAIEALPTWPLPSVDTVPTTVRGRKSDLDLSDVAVIVGLGEVGPCGSSRTRHELEIGDDLSPAAVLELAWLTGLVRFDDNGRGGTWIDTESDETVNESAIAGRYREAVRERVGIRFIEEETVGFDPKAMPVLTTVYLERDMTFTVSSEEEARAFVESHPEQTRASHDEESDTWKVTRLAGSVIKVPKETRMDRFIGGQIPRGFDFTRYGVPREMVENTDRLALFNLIATVEAFISAGLSPEELMRWVHPARVGNTQGAGIGGMMSLHRLYTDQLLDVERQSDILQETLINVVAAYTVQAYVGSYGPMSNPVAACATAAVSLEDAVDKLAADKADFVVAGGFDDIGQEGFVGFADMNATANTDECLAMGLTPSEISRANDVRRKGFVEAQGGGTLLVTRASIALEMGLPVYGVVGYVGSFGDGIQKSVPAPGMGALAAVLGGKQSPLARSLDRFGMTTDDIALVYKHDTSTNANDPNENNLHQQIQEVLGRTDGNPLWVVSQKSLTGHSKGGAAAWQLAGLCQALGTGIISGNKNLDSVDPAMEDFGHIAFTNESLRPGAGSLKAGLVTSLGFGHVSGIALILHPDALLAHLPKNTRDAYQAVVDERLRDERDRFTDILLGTETAFSKRTHRRFKADDGTEAQEVEEREMLTKTEARFDPIANAFVTDENRS